MEVVHPRCAGLDVHKDTVVACIRLVEDGSVRQEVRTFKTTTGALCELADWLDQEGCTHAVMEATGVYWKPVWHVCYRSRSSSLFRSPFVRPFDPSLLSPFPSRAF